MTTYVTQSNIMKRFFFLVGKTKDTFVDESLASYDLEYMVFDHLKQLGYERIMFYGKVQKLFCYDEHSYQLVLNSAQGQVQAAPRKPMLTKGPLGGRLLNGTKQPGTSSITPPPNVLHFGKMNDLDAFQRIDYCMHDKKHKTAVIFNNAEDFLAFFGQVRTDRGSESIQSKIFDSINNYDGLPFDNSNIMLFIFPQRSLNETMSVYGSILEEDFLRKSKEIFEYWTTRKTEDFGNARDVRKYFAQCRDTLYERLEREYGITAIPEAARHTYTGDDIPADLRGLLHDAEGRQNAIEKLDTSSAFINKLFAIS